MALSLEEIVGEFEHRRKELAEEDAVCVRVLEALRGDGTQATRKSATPGRRPSSGRARRGRPRKASRR